MKQYGIDESQLKDAIHEITTLNPKPGNIWGDSFSDGMSQVVPDFIVDVQDGEITLSLNNSQLPELRINRSYTQMLEDYMGNKQNQTRERKDALLFVKQKLDAAQWFVDAVKQRQQTLLQTMQVIIDLQKEFFLTGDESTLKPMILKDVAERTGFDISTISRASNSK